MTAETAPRRSDATRAAILAAARHRFAQDGFRKATIRAIAADARIDPSMVMRYYGNKEGLFYSSLEIDLELPDLGVVQQDLLGEAIVRRFLELWETPPSDEILLTLLRSAMTDDSVAQHAQRIFGGQIMPMVLRVGDPADAPRRAGLIASQMLGIALCRYVLRLEPVVAMTHAELAADLAPVLQRYLTARPGES
ncbi:TetR/AcrR family transcriptional regulator [Nocardia miyunensis]|uniref:TetR/AcrR family transcriptional regulator n=1 Tax=Nocardia miyunensis TaxID=282684 RepID=UPI000833F0EF|nr:TetR family transcriptional regulator [Nocardia miyunensis]